MVAFFRQGGVSLCEVKTEEVEIFDIQEEIIHAYTCRIVLSCVVCNGLLHRVTG